MIDRRTLLRADGQAKAVSSTPVTAVSRTTALATVEQGDGGVSAAKDIHGVYDTNVYGPVRVTHAFLPLLQAADNPRVVMVTGAGGLSRS